METEIQNNKDRSQEEIQNLKREIVRSEQAIKIATNKILEEDKYTIQKNVSIKERISSLNEKGKNQIELNNKTYEVGIADIEAEAKQYEDVANKEITPTADLQIEAKNTEEMKSYINEYKRIVGLQEDVEKLNVESENFTTKIEKARTLPGEILEQSNIPVKGLSVKDGIPLINGLPISNLSDGEKLTLCIDVATMKDTSLNSLLIDGIEKLTSVNRETLYKTLKAKGVQFISARTTDDKELTVIEL